MASLHEILDGYDWGGSADELEALLRPYYEEVMGIAYGDADKLLPASVTYDVGNPLIKKGIDRLAKRIRGVADTTQDEIRGLVAKALEGQEGADGETHTPSVQEIAKQIREKGEVSSKSRSTTIARTETGTAYNLGHTYAYEDAGIEKVEVMDGDDDEECAAADGQIWTLEEAREQPLAHPNCTRAFSPVVE